MCTFHPNFLCENILVFIWKNTSQQPQIQLHNELLDLSMKIHSLEKSNHKRILQMRCL